MYFDNDHPFPSSSQGRPFPSYPILCSFSFRSFPSSSFSPSSFTFIHSRNSLSPICATLGCRIIRNCWMLHPKWDLCVTPLPSRLRDHCGRRSKKNVVDDWQGSNGSTQETEACSSQTNPPSLRVSALSMPLASSERNWSFSVCHLAELLLHGTIMDLSWGCLLKIDVPDPCS